jgi:hypothetical protein
MTHGDYSVKHAFSGISILMRLPWAQVSNSKYDFGGLMLVVKTGRHT